MEVITVESEAFKKMQAMLSEMKALVEKSQKEVKINNITVLSAEEVAKCTGYAAKTILAWKDEIGYHAKGKFIKFFPEDVEKWLKLYKKKSILDLSKIR